jgi:iron complex outermembrane receptor protein
MSTLSNWYISNASATTGGTGRISDTPNRRWNLDLQKELQLNPKDLMVFGVNYRNDWIHNQESYLSNWKDDSSKTGIYSQAEGSSKTIGIFGQDEHKINDKLSMTLGARYDTWTSYNGMNQDNSTAVSDPVYYADRSDSALCPKVAFQYKLDNTSGVHLSWGKSFQAPDLYTMYRSWISGTTLYDGNPDLKPQKVTSIELGWNKKMSEKTNVNVTYFHNDITDMVYRQSLGTKTIDGTTYIWQRYENAGEGTTNGVELELSHRMNANWTSFLNYTYQRAIISQNAANSASVGKFVQQVPEQILNIGFDYQKEKLSGTLFASYVGKRYSTDINNDTVNGVYGSYDPYFIVNTSLVYKWDKDDSVTFAVNNLFNRQYFCYYVAPGRTYGVQVTHKF